MKRISIILLIIVSFFSVGGSHDNSIFKPAEDCRFIYEGAEDIPTLIKKGSMDEFTFTPYQPEKFEKSAELERVWEFRWQESVANKHRPTLTILKKGIRINDHLISFEDGNMLDKSVLPKTKGSKFKTDYTNELVLSWGDGAQKTLSMQDFEGNVFWETQLPAFHDFNPVFYDRYILGINNNQNARSHTGVWKINLFTGETEWDLEIYRNTNQEHIFEHNISGDDFLWLKTYEGWGDKEGYEYRCFRINPKNKEVLEIDIEFINDMFEDDDFVYILSDTHTSIGLLTIMHKETLEITAKIDVEKYVEKYMEQNKDLRESYSLIYVDGKYDLFFESYITPLYERCFFMFPPGNPENIKKVHNPQMAIPSEYRYHDFDMYWDELDDRVYGLNTWTGEETWSIEKNLIHEKNPNKEVFNKGILSVFPDKRGVLVLAFHLEENDEGDFERIYTIQCFR